MSSALGINGSGQVIGYSTTGTGEQRAFLWSGGTMRDLGSLGGPNSGALGINAAGQVVGWANSPGIITHAFPFGDASASPLQLPGAFRFGSDALVNLALPVDAFSEASGINASGQVVGWWDSPVSGPHRPFLASGGVMQDLIPVDPNFFPLGATGEATAINNAGQVVGWARIPGENERAFISSGGSAQYLVTLGGSFSIALGINASGEVVGYSRSAAGFDHAFLFSNGTMQDLGTLGSVFSFSRANGINASGQIVGDSASSEGLAHHAFLHRGGVMQDLNDLIPTGSGWELTSGAAINDAGQIVGVGILHSKVHAFLLTPSAVAQ